MRVDAEGVKILVRDEVLKLDLGRVGEKKAEGSEKSTQLSNVTDRTIREEENEVKTVKTERIVPKNAKMNNSVVLQKKSQPLLTE